MNARIRRKWLREAERSIADACRLYLTRPRGGSDAGTWERISRDILSISLALTLDQWAQHGPGRLRQSAVLDVTIEDVAEHPDRVVLAGVVRWSRRHAGKDTESTERLRLECPVPSLRKTPKSVRPRIALEVTDTSAA